MKGKIHEMNPLWHLFVFSERFLIAIIAIILISYYIPSLSFISYGGEKIDDN
jgi:hypothetical protein